MGCDTLSPTIGSEGLEFDAVHPDIVCQQPSGAGSMGDSDILPNSQPQQVVECLPSEGGAGRVPVVDGALESPQQEVRNSIITTRSFERLDL